MTDDFLKELYLKAYNFPPIGCSSKHLAGLQAVRDYYATQPSRAEADRNIDRYLLERTLPLLRGHVHGAPMVELIEKHLKVDGDGQPYERGTSPQEGK